MKFTASLLFTIFAVGALALPEPLEEAPAAMPRCVANQANCAGSKYIGDDNCRCSGQKAPCGNWKCGWDVELRLPGQRMLMDQLSNGRSTPHATHPHHSTSTRDQDQASGTGWFGGHLD
ncbi:hypothetical protein DHEL01_v209380 [Diaporthe helianthi]|uniref:Uncharacterized protein n=1 Tax=Diaporthe helianthi TaxID=158607 RepID=A0A2P5HPQ8_DIAHE|nr:hypothetical protein DHEL01_v209380 [Diaporthe helianthi]